MQKRIDSLKDVEADLYYQSLKFTNKNKMKNQ